MEPGDRPVEIGFGAPGIACTTRDRRTSDGGDVQVSAHTFHRNLKPFRILADVPTGRHPAVTKIAQACAFVPLSAIRLVWWGWLGVAPHLTCRDSAGAV